MVSGKQLRDAFLCAAGRIQSERQTVDALNVFPVPDGDTGTNMSMTIGNTVRELEKLPDSASVAQASAVAASALLRGARGNSGVILSLLFRGFSKELHEKQEASPADFAAALERGVKAAYKAVMKPTEGTILTVARLAAQRASELAEAGVEDGAFWSGVVEAASAALETTPELLPVLKKAGVVDAGGKGFLIVLEGMNHIFQGGSLESVAESVPPQAQAGPTLVEFDTTGGFDGQITFTYCTEFLIDRDSQKDSVSLRAYLESIGDCVVVVDDEEIVKVHVHTDNPGKAIEEALGYGSLTKVKIENMREQFAQAGLAAAEKVSDTLPYVPVDPERKAGFVVIAAGDGVCSLFQDLGADHVVSGGQTMNPSTDDILSAIQATPAKTVFVLPNNKNIIMAAEQAARLADRDVRVLQTLTIPQGMAAMLNYNPEADVAANSAAMTQAAERVSTGLVTFAARDSDFDGHHIKQGELLALEGGKLLFTETNVEKTLVRLVRSMTGKETSFITVLYGEDIDEEQAEQAESALREKLSGDIELSFISGGQPVYYFIVSVE